MGLTLSKLFYSFLSFLLHFFDFLSFQLLKLVRTSSLFNFYLKGTIFGQLWGCHWLGFLHCQEDSMIILFNDILVNWFFLLLEFMIFHFFRLFNFFLNGGVKVTHIFSKKRRVIKVNIIFFNIFELIFVFFFSLLFSVKSVR